MSAEDTDIAEIIADVREQIVYLKELGVESISANPRDVEQADTISDLKFQISTSGPENVLRSSKAKVENAEPRPPAGSRLASLPKLSPTSATPVPSSSEAALFESERALPEPTETIEQIRAEIGPDCTRCPLCALGRSQVVNSVGNFNADLMFVGEAPGADEDRLGEPFVGRAGQLLTDIIEKGLQMKRGDIFIGNINRCRPPGNRTPLPEEAAICKPFLFREVAVVRPKVIVVLGAHAAQTLLETKTPISKMRGRFHEYLGVKVMPTFHPAYLLRDPHKKREVWEDIKMVRDYLNTGTTN